MIITILVFPVGSVVKNPSANAGDASFIPGLGRSPGGGNGNPPQYSCLENHEQRSHAGYSPWGHKKSRKRLSNHAHITINYNKSCVNVVSLSNCTNLMPFPP